MATGLLSDVGDTKRAVTVGESAQWGLASLLISGLLLLAAPVTLIFNILLWQAGPFGIALGPAFVGAGLSLLVILGLTACGIAFGLKGRRMAADDRRPSPLTTAGVLTGVAALLLWLVVGIDLIAILCSFAS